MPHQDLFDLARIDVHAAADDHILLAVHDVDEAFFVAYRQITNTHPAIAEGLAAGFGLTPVTIEQIGRVTEQFAHLAGADLPALLIAQRDHGHGKGLPHAARLAQLVGWPDVADDAGLGAAIGFMQDGAAEELDDFFLGGLGQWCGIRDDGFEFWKLQAGECLCAKAEDGVEMCGHHEGAVEMIVGQTVQHLLGIEARHDVAAPAEEDRCQSKGKACTVVHRCQRQGAVFR